MLKLQYSGHLMQRTDSFENKYDWERLKVGGEEGEGETYGESNIEIYDTTCKTDSQWEFAV